MSLNRLIVTGRLTKDLEFKQINDKMTVGKFTLAVNTYSKGTNETIFLDCTIWNQLAIRCATVLKKGSNILFEGKLKQDKWVDKDTAKERTKIVAVGDNIIFLDPKESQMEKLEEEYVPTGQQSIDVIDMELPF